MPIDVPTLKGTRLDQSAVLRMRLVEGRSLEAEVFVRPAPGRHCFLQASVRAM